MIFSFFKIYLVHQKSLLLKFYHVHLLLFWSFKTIKIYLEQLHIIKIHFIKKNTLHKYGTIETLF